MTRVRGPGATFFTPPEGVTRSVFRRVIRERAAVLAADAPDEIFSSESLLGASIRSTLAVPLWRGANVVGVLQADNRDAPAMFDSTDMEALAAGAFSGGSLLRPQQRAPSGSPARASTRSSEPSKLANPRRRPPCY